MREVRVRHRPLTYLSTHLRLPSTYLHLLVSATKSSVEGVSEKVSLMHEVVLLRCQDF
jgi:hypothetical protein